MALLDSFYGETPSYLGGLLGADELARLKEQAQSQSNLGMAAALLQAGAPSRTPTGGALAIAQGLQQGQQLYKQALNQGLQEKMAGMQVQELMRKQQEAEAMRQFLPKLIQPGAVEQNWSGAPEQIGQYFKTGQVPTTQAPSTINREALQRLALVSPETYAKYKPEYKEVNGQLVEISPLGGITTVAGQAKEDLAGPVKQAMQVLGINKPFAEVTPQERSMIGNYIDRQESLKAPKVAVDLKDPTAVAKAQADLLKDWRGVVKDSGATEIANRFVSLGAAMNEANKGNKAADGAIIYNIGKIYDPSGAVQEGDKNTILGNRSIPNEVKAYAQKVFEGGSLLPEERQGLYAVAGSMVKQRQKQLQADQANYKSLATQLGGTGDYIKDPFADVFSPKVEQNPVFDLGSAKAQAAEILKKRRGL
jgi:surface antigen